MVVAKGSRRCSLEWMRFANRQACSAGPARAAVSANDRVTECASVPDRYCLPLLGFSFVSILYLSYFCSGYQRSMAADKSVPDVAMFGHVTAVVQAFQRAFLVLSDSIGSARRISPDTVAPKTVGTPCFVSILVLTQLVYMTIYSMKLPSFHALFFRASSTAAAPQSSP